MKEKITFNEIDLIKVYQLHSMLEKKHIIFVVAIFICFVLYVSLEKDNPIVLIVSGLFGGIGGWAIYQFLFLRFKAKKIFKQQKGLHNSFEFEITNESLHISSSKGSSSTPWPDFCRTKENKKYLLLYFSDALFLSFPKSRISEKFLRLLKEKINS